ncbi:NUDIX domain-containing protein [Nocardia sp. NPDC004573]
MPEESIKEKVVVYVVRDGKLLVFRHPDFSWEEVGIQDSRRSIRAGETSESSAVREAREETGLSEFEIVRKLGEADYNMSPYRFEIQCSLTGQKARECPSTTVITAMS